MSALSYQSEVLSAINSLRSEMVALHERVARVEEHKETRLNWCVRMPALRGLVFLSLK